MVAALSSAVFRRGTVRARRPLWRWRAACTTPPVPPFLQPLLQVRLKTNLLNVLAHLHPLRVLGQLRAENLHVVEAHPADFVLRICAFDLHGRTSRSFLADSVSFSVAVIVTGPALIVIFAIVSFR